MTDIAHNADKQINFDVAIVSLQELLSGVGWPSAIIWVDKSQFTKLPAATIGSKGHERLILFCPPAVTQESLARTEFDHARNKGWIVRLEAIGKLDNQITYACVNSSSEPEQGETGITGGVKILVAAYAPRIIKTHSRLLSLAVRYYLRHWEKQRDSTFSI